MSEEWKTVKNFDKYLINKNGVIKNKKTDYILKQYVERGGYYHIILYDSNGKPKNRYVHRLVMETFCPRDDMTEL